MSSNDADPHSVHSVLRERIIEHLFIGDALRRLWQLGVRDAEILRSEFDAGGYDLVISRRGVVRHIQLKTVLVGGKTADVKFSVNLLGRPSGCVLWIVVTPELVIDSYLWFGGKPGETLPDISLFRIAKHTKGDAQGIKAKLPHMRIVSRRRFERLSTLDEVLLYILGPLP